MPLQGVFNADFSKFTAACATAEASLKGFETGASKTEAALNKMADSVSGQKIVQQAYLATKAVEDIGGAANLTEKELTRMSAIAAEGAEKLQKMGQTVPADMQKLANATKENADNTGLWNSALSTLSGTFGALSLQRVIDQVIQFGKEVFADADQLERLGDRTGIGVETLQRLRVVGADAGVSLDSMANAMNRLQKNIGEGTSGTAGALAQLGLAFEDIKRMSPEEKFYAISEALKQVDDDDKRVALGVQLMGKGFTELLPAIKAGFDGVKDSAAGMSKGTVAALDGAGDAVGRFYQSVKNNIGEAIADVLTLSTSQWRALKSAMEDLPKVGPPIANMWGQILPPSVPKDLDDIIAKSDAWGASSKAMAAAMVELDSAGKGWQGTLNTINGEVVEAVKWYLDAGVSQQALATAFGLTDAQVKAVAASMKDYTETIKLVQKVETERYKQAEVNEFGLSKTENEQSQLKLTNEGKTNTALLAMRKQLTDDSMKLSMDRTTYENLKVWEAAEEQIAAFQKTGATAAQVSEFSDMVYEHTATAAAAVYGVAKDTLVNITDEGIRQMMRLVADHEKELADAAQKAKAAADEASNAWKNVRYSMESSYTSGDLQARAAKTPGSSVERDYYGNEYLYIPGVNAAPPSVRAPGIRGFASGVENFAGGLAIVGERGPELVNLPGGSDVIPNGRAGGVTQIFNISQPLGTPDAIARAVADAQVGLMRGQGVRLPYGT
jgi:hypothetical protein